MAVRIGLDELYYAEWTDDTTYDTPVQLKNVTELTFTANTDVATFFADDGAAETFSQLGDMEVEVSVGDIPPSDYAKLVGATYDETTGLVTLKSTDASPYVALGFRSQKSNGDYRYVWFYKGKFGVPDETYQTKQDSVNFQPQTITYKPVQNDSKEVFRRVDSDDTNADPDLITNWFTEPTYTPSV